LKQPTPVVQNWDPAASTWIGMATTTTAPTIISDATTNSIPNFIIEYSYGPILKS